MSMTVITIILRKMNTDPSLDIYAKTGGKQLHKAGTCAFASMTGEGPQKALLSRGQRWGSSSALNTARRRRDAPYSTLTSLTCESIWLATPRLHGPGEGGRRLGGARERWRGVHPRCASTALKPRRAVKLEEKTFLQAYRANVNLVSDLKKQRVLLKT